MHLSEREIEEVTQLCHAAYGIFVPGGYHERIEQEYGRVDIVRLRKAIGDSQANKPASDDDLAFYGYIIKAYIHAFSNWDWVCPTPGIGSEGVCVQRWSNLADRLMAAGHGKRTTPPPGRVIENYGDYVNYLDQKIREKMEQEDREVPVAPFHSSLESAMRLFPEAKRIEMTRVWQYNSDDEGDADVFVWYATMDPERACCAPPVGYGWTPQAALLQMWLCDKGVVFRSETTSLPEHKPEIVGHSKKDGPIFK